MNDRAENNSIQQVSQTALTEYRQLLGRIIEDVVENTLQNSTQDGKDLNHINLLPAGFEFTLKMLDGAASVGDLALLEDQLQWAMHRLPHQGIMPDHLLKRFQLLAIIMEEVLSEPSWDEFQPYVQWMVTRQLELVAEFQTRNQN
jgi:hypothetical protein